MKPHSRIPIGLVALTLASIALALIVFWSFGGGPGPASNLPRTDEGGQERFEGAERTGPALSPAIFAVFVLSLMTTYWLGRQSSPLRSAGAGRGQLIDPSFGRARASLRAAVQPPPAALGYQAPEPGSPSGRAEPPTAGEPARPGEPPESRAEDERSQAIDRIKRFAEAENLPQPDGEESEQIELFGPPSVLEDICAGRRPLEPEAPTRARRKLSTTGLQPGPSLEPSLIFSRQAGLRAPRHCPLRSAMRALVRDMGQISTAGRQLDRLVKIMDGFVFQANLLALEAAVESGRAGPGGGGLITVAAKSRQLAVGSAEAARNTADLVACVQAQMEAGMEEAQSLAEQVINAAPGEEGPEALPRPDAKPADSR